MGFVVSYREEPGRFQAPTRFPSIRPQGGVP
jgi:hypothetical protein